MHPRAVRNGQSPTAGAQAQMSVAATIGVMLILPAIALARGAPPIGRNVGPLAFSDLRGRHHAVASWRDSRAAVFVFLSTQCPISKRYGARLSELARAYSRRGVRWFAVDPMRDESAAEVARDAAQRGFSFPVVADPTRRLADRLGARVTPQAVVLDNHGAIRYRGRIDDNADRTKVRSPDLRRALDALLAGRPVPHPETIAFGCAIPRLAPPRANGPITFARDVAPILQRRCQSCHRPGQAGPFPLLTYAQV